MTPIPELLPSDIWAIFQKDGWPFSHLWAKKPELLDNRGTHYIRHDLAIPPETLERVYEVLNLYASWYDGVNPAHEAIQLLEPYRKLDQS